MIPDDYNMANLIAGIAGGVEAPIQFIFQVMHLNSYLKFSFELKFFTCITRSDLIYCVLLICFKKVWLIINGILPSPFHDSSQIVIIDFYGNALTLPTISAFSLVFSILSILKTVIVLNIFGIHIKVTKSIFMHNKK